MNEIKERDSLSSLVRGKWIERYLSRKSAFLVTVFPREREVD